MPIANISLRPAADGDWRSTASLLFENNLPHEGARAQRANFLVATAGATDNDAVRR